MLAKKQKTVISKSFIKTLAQKILAKISLPVAKH